MDLLSLSYIFLNLIKTISPTPPFLLLPPQVTKPIHKQTTESKSLNRKKKMGRDWSWLGGGGGKKKSSSKSKKDIKTTTPPSSSPDGNTATAAGCMSAVFNIFDLQHLQFPINHHHLHLPKGTIFFFFDLFKSLPLRLFDFLLKPVQA